MNLTLIYFRSYSGTLGWISIKIYSIGVHGIRFIGVTAFASDRKLIICINSELDRNKREDLAS